MLVFTAEHTQVQVHGMIIFTRVFHAKATRAHAETVSTREDYMTRAFTHVLSCLHECSYVTALA